MPSYGPQVAARYFKKLECFCFTQQTLQPGEVRRMPVVFVIDAGLPQDVNTVTLSYTFFEVEGRNSAGETEMLVAAPADPGRAQDRPPRAGPDRCRS